MFMFPKFMTVNSEPQGSKMERLNGGWSCKIFRTEESKKGAERSDCVNAACALQISSLLAATHLSCSFAYIILKMDYSVFHIAFCLCINYVF